MLHLNVGVNEVVYDGKVRRGRRRREGDWEYRLCDEEM